MSDFLILTIQFGVLVQFCQWQMKWFFLLNWTELSSAEATCVIVEKFEVLSPCIIPSYLSSTH